MFSLSAIIENPFKIKKVETSEIIVNKMLPSNPKGEKSNRGEEIGLPAPNKKNPAKRTNDAIPAILKCKFSFSRFLQYYSTIL